MLQAHCVVIEGVKVVEQKPPKKAAVRFAIRTFEDRGFTVHSTMGLVLAPMVNYCVRNERPFTLTHLPRGGYVLRRELLNMEQHMMLEATSRARLAVLMDAVQYAVNRLDAAGAQVQVAGDLAVALAYARNEKLPDEALG